VVVDILHFTYICVITVIFGTILVWLAVPSQVNRQSDILLFTTRNRLETSLFVVCIVTLIVAAANIVVTETSVAEIYLCACFYVFAGD